MSISDEEVKQAAKGAFAELMVMAKEVSVPFDYITTISVGNYRVMRAALRAAAKVRATREGDGHKSSAGSGDGTDMEVDYSAHDEFAALAASPIPATGGEKECDPDGCKAHIDAFMGRAINAETENARLREALEPFAAIAEDVAINHPGWDHDEFQISRGMSFAPFRRARAALSQEAPK